jgi:hypothetical protein
MISSSTSVWDSPFETQGIDPSRSLGCPGNGLTIPTVPGKTTAQPLVEPERK